MTDDEDDRIQITLEGLPLYVAMVCVFLLGAIFGAAVML